GGGAELPRADRRVPPAGRARRDGSLRRRLLRRRAARRRPRGRHPRGGGTKVILTVCALDAEPLVATERRAAIALYDVWAPAAAPLAARLGAVTRGAVSRRAAELHALPGAVVVPDVAGDAVALAGAATGADRVVRVTELCPEPVVTIAGEIDRPGVR